MQVSLQRRTVGVRPSGRLSAQPACILGPKLFHASHFARTHVPAAKNVIVLQRVVVVHSTQKPLTPVPAEENIDQITAKISEIVPSLNKELQGSSVYLVGMMGSGKSTVGKLLANTLHYAFFDTDSMIEAAHDKTPVSDIFKEHGEDYFRNCETAVLKELSPFKNLVVATGGGAVIRPVNWSYLHSGVVAWLTGSVDLLARRVSKDGLSKRPLLMAGAEGKVSEAQLYAAAKGKIEKLMGDRTQFYQKADIVVSLDGLGEHDMGAPAMVVLYRLLTALQQQVAETKREREAAALKLQHRQHGQQEHLHG